MAELLVLTKEMFHRGSRLILLTSVDILMALRLRALYRHSRKGIYISSIHPMVIAQVEF